MLQYHQNSKKKDVEKGEANGWEFAQIYQLAPLILTTNMQGKYYPNLTDEETQHWTINRVDTYPKVTHL